MKLKAGQSLVSAVDDTTVIAIRTPDADVTVTCGGVVMTDTAGDKQAADPSQQDGTLIGKRYADEELGIELLCTKAGSGTLAVNGTPLPLKESKPLPASD